MLKHVKRLLSEQKGQGMAEYGLILALVAVVVIGALKLLGEGIKTKFNDVKGGLEGTDPVAGG
jgi:pilus assembly protein Flp/PilA